MENQCLVTIVDLGSTERDVAAEDFCDRSYLCSRYVASKGPVS